VLRTRVIDCAPAASAALQQRERFALAPPQSRRKPPRSAWALAALLASSPALAQQPPVPDELDFQGRSNILVGSGARALGMAGAFVARADDATAASWNPAGLSYLRRPEFSLAGALDRFDVETRSPDRDPIDDSDDRRRGSAIDFVAVTWPLELGRVGGAVQFSYQRVISFNGDQDIVRNLTPIHIESEGGFDVFAFGTGVQLWRKLRVGATLNRWTNGYNQRLQRLEGNAPEERFTEIDFSGWNVNAGVMVTPIESLNLGLVAKTPFTADVRQIVQRTNLADPGGPPENRFDSNSPGYPRIEIDFPGAVGVGASWRPSNPWTLSIDYTRTFWSEGRIRNFFSLPGSGPPMIPGPRYFEELPYPKLDEVEQKDTEQIRLGGEYVAFRGKDFAVPLRAGWFNDRQYFRDQDGNAPRFNAVAVGAGLVVGRVLFDVAYTYEFGNYLDPDQSGNRISVRSQQLFFSLIYRHHR